MRLEIEKFLLLSQEEYPDPPIGGRGEVVCQTMKLTDKPGLAVLILC
jgi:hypothetical protein